VVFSSIETVSQSASQSISQPVSKSASQSVSQYALFYMIQNVYGARSSVVVKALWYKPEGREFETL
jgi:hypothetical protein